MRINNSIRNMIGIMLLLSLARRLPPHFRIPPAFLNIFSKDYPDGTIRITTIKTGLNDLSSGAVYDSLTAQQICPNPNDTPFAVGFQDLIPHPLTDTPTFTAERCIPGTIAFDDHGLWGTGMGCSAQTSHVKKMEIYMKLVEKFEPVYVTPHTWTICNYKCREDIPESKYPYARSFALFQSPNNQSILVPKELRPHSGQLPADVDTSICYQHNRPRG